MQKHLIFAAALLLPFTAVHAQPSPAKKPLVARILKLQQPAIEAMARSMAERPALAMLERADQVLNTSIPVDKREATGKAIQADIKKYLDETVPFVRDRAVKLAPASIGTTLEDKFSEDELRQLANFLESATYTKYLQLGGDMQKALLEKLLADTRSTVEPKVVALDQTVARRLGVTVPAAAAPSTPAAK